MNAPSYLFLSKRVLAACSILQIILNNMYDPPLFFFCLLLFSPSGASYWIHAATCKKRNAEGAL